MPKKRRPPEGWTTAADLNAQLRKWWESGELLAALVEGESAFPRRLKLKAPDSRELSEQFDEVRSWIAEIQQLHRYRVEMRELNHRILGKNMLPAEIWIDSLDDALSLLGKRRDCSRFEQLIQLARAGQPELLAWLKKRPLAALELASCFEQLLDVVSWLQAHPRPQVYLRQVDIKGIDTKFLERHRGVLAEMLDLALPAEYIDATYSGVGQFVRRYGFRDKPARVRFRVLDPQRQLLPEAGTDQDVTIDSKSFNFLDPQVSHVFITENETNFLSFPTLPDSLVIFGAGYGFDMLADAGWLLQRQIFYWGDIDTHGFAILSAARSGLPHIQSLLMDEATVLHHREFWVEESSQHDSVQLPNLTPPEQLLFKNLKQNRWRANLRLEQERISWSYACEAIKDATAGAPVSCRQINRV